MGGYVNTPVIGMLYDNVVQSAVAHMAPAESKKLVAQVQFSERGLARLKFCKQNENKQTGGEGVNASECKTHLAPSPSRWFMPAQH